MPSRKMWYIMSNFFLLVLVTFVNGEVLQLKCGSINGTVEKSRDGRSYQRFYGIPYAEPPIEMLRFQDPVPVRPWQCIKNASVPGPICIQPKIFAVNNLLVGKEDCLYLNVFTPVDLSASTAKAPVMVNIHGGGFQYGSGSFYDPHYFMDFDVVFVTLNYRLGVFGFFGMNNDIISGNFGLKDQALALQWIKQNIAAFGGDPDKITLMGESAGAASVNLHMYSPLSKGLFHKAIMQSGSLYAPWVLNDDVYNEDVGKAFTVIAGCSKNRENFTKILNCLQKVPAEELFKMSNRLYVWDIEPVPLFRPSIESNVTKRPFLPKTPTNDTFVNRVPWISGMNSGEGALRVMVYLQNDGQLLEIINNDKERYLPIVGGYALTAEPEIMDVITQKIVDFYFNNDDEYYDEDDDDHDNVKDNPANETLKYVQIFTDNMFGFPLIKTILSSNGLRYVYFYDHRGSNSLQDMYNLTTDLGVCHADELFLLFRFEKLEDKWTLEDKRVSEILLKFWVNFAIYTNPNGKHEDEIWKPVESDDIEYLHIKSDSLKMEINLIKDRFDLWDSLPLRRKSEF